MILVLQIGLRGLLGHTTFSSRTRRFSAATSEIIGEGEIKIMKADHCRARRSRLVLQGGPSLAPLMTDLSL